MKNYFSNSLSLFSLGKLLLLTILLAGCGGSGGGSSAGGSGGAGSNVFDGVGPSTDETIISGENDLFKFFVTEINITGFQQQLNLDPNGQSELAPHLSFTVEYYLNRRFIEDGIGLDGEESEYKEAWFAYRDYGRDNGLDIWDSYEGNDVTGTFTDDGYEAFFAAIKPNMNDWGAVRFVVDKADQELSDSAKLHASRARLELVPMWFAKQLYYMPRDKDGKIIVAADDEISYWEVTGDDLSAGKPQTLSNHIMSDPINPTFNGEVIKLGPLRLKMQVTYQGIAAIKAAADEAAADATSDDGRYLFIGLDLKEPEKSAELTYKLHAVIGEEIISSEPIKVADSAKLTWEPKIPPKEEEKMLSHSAEITDSARLTSQLSINPYVQQPLRIPVEVPRINYADGYPYSLRALSDYQAYGILMTEFQPKDAADPLAEVYWQISGGDQFYKTPVNNQEYLLAGYENFMVKLPKRLFPTAIEKRDENQIVGPIFNSDNRDSTRMLFFGADAGDSSRDSFFLISLVELTALDTEVYKAHLSTDFTEEGQGTAAYEILGEVRNGNSDHGPFGAEDTFLAIPQRDENGEILTFEQGGEQLPVYQRVDVNLRLTHAKELKNYRGRDIFFNEHFMLRRHLLPLGGILFK